MSGDNPVRDYAQAALACRVVIKADKAVLLALCIRARRQDGEKPEFVAGSVRKVKAGWCWRSESGLAIDSGLSKRTVIRAIQSLVDSELITYIQEGGLKGEAKTNNIYRVNWDALVDGAVPVSDNKDKSVPKDECEETDFPCEDEESEEDTTQEIVYKGCDFATDLFDSLGKPANLEAKLGNWEDQFCTYLAGSDRLDNQQVKNAVFGLGCWNDDDSSSLQEVGLFYYKLLSETADPCASFIANLPTIWSQCAHANPNNSRT
jgi:hypothetical protein